MCFGRSLQDEVFLFFFTVDCHDHRKHWNQRKGKEEGSLENTLKNPEKITAVLEKVYVRIQTIKTSCCLISKSG